MENPITNAYYEALKIIVERDKEIAKIKAQNKEDWQLLCREVGLSENDPEPFVHIIMLVDNLKEQIKQQNEDRIKLARSC